jgi:hypothetical protein
VIGLYRIVVEVINVTLIVTLVADGVFPKASRPNASFPLLRGAGLKAEGGMRFAFPPYGYGIKNRDSEFTK